MVSTTVVFGSVLMCLGCNNFLKSILVFFFMGVLMVLEVVCMFCWGQSLLKLDIVARQLNVSGKFWWSN